MNAAQSLEQLVKNSDVFRRTTTESYDIFMSYLFKKVSEKTGQAKIKPSSIAKDCESKGYTFPSNVFTFKRKKTYDMNPDKLAAISRTYNFDLYETVELFEYFGRCLNTFEEPGKSLIKDQEIPENLKDKIGQEEYIDCLFDIIKRKSESYSFNLADCSSFYTKNRELIDSGQIDKAYEEFTKYIKSAGNEHQWRVELNTDYRKENDRERLFEIGYLCAFSLEEIKRLYRSKGYLLAPQYIKFDTFVDFIMNYDKENYNYAFYKSVCSDIDTKYEKFDETPPDFGVILRELGICDEYHHRPYEMERDL